MKLGDIFPLSCISSSEMDKIVYARDASEYEGKCKIVVWPTSVEQIYKLVHYARRTGEKLTIRGAGTSSYGGTVPADSIVVDMSKMNKILEVGSDYVIVEAGAVLDNLNLVLRENRKFFPVVPLEHQVCTIGGMVSTNCLGLETYYGKMGDWVQELRIVDGTGKSLTLGTSPSKAFIGTEGIMGIICSVKLKVLPKPQFKTVSIFKFNTITALMNKVSELKKYPPVLSITYLDDFSSNILNLGEMLHLIVDYGDESGVIKDKEEIMKINGMKEDLQHLLIKKRYGEKEDPVIPPENVGKFLHWLRKNRVPCFAYINEGIVHPCFRDFSKMPREMYTVVEKLKGKVIGEYPVGIKRKEFIEKNEEDKLLLFKNQYDNLKIMNRGVLID